MNRARLAVFFYFLLLPVPAFSQILINAEFHDEPLLSALDRLSANYSLKFAYDNKLLQNIRVTVHIKDQSPEKAIKEILEGTNLTFEIRDNVFLIKPREDKDAIANSRDKTFLIQCIIRDSATFENLPYATICDIKKNFCFTSNPDGYFTYPVTSTDSVCLQINYLGYRKSIIIFKKEIPSKIYCIYLSPAEIEFKEVIILNKQIKPLQKEDDAGHYTVNPVNMLTLPQIGENDLLHSIELLPGINATNENNLGLSVRGTMPEQSLIVLDGINLYHADHFFGEFSAINPVIIKNVQIYKGGFEAKYGGRATALALLTVKNGDLNKPSFNLNLNLLSASIKTEIPFGKKVSFLFAARRSYTDILKSNVYNSIFKSIKNNEDETILNFGGVYESIDNKSTPDFYYYDLNAKLSYTPDNKNTLAASFFKSHDYFTITNINDQNLYSSITKTKSNWGNIGGSLRWARKWNEKFYNNISFGISEFLNIYDDRGNYTLLNSNPYKISDYEVNKIRDINVAFNNEIGLSDMNKIEFGLQTTNHTITYRQDIDSTQSQVLQSMGTESAIYLQTRYFPLTRLSLVLGIRTTYSSLAGKYFIEPRFSALYFITDEISFKCAVSRHSQLINKSSFNNNAEVHRDFWYNAYENNLTPLTSNHFISGFSYSNSLFNADIEFYFMKFYGLTMIRQNNERNLLSLKDNLYTGNGYSKGVDIFIYKKAGLYDVWAGYSYCISNNTFPKINQGKEFPSDNDQRHEFKIVNMYHGKTWSFSAVWVYGSGMPYTNNAGYAIRLPNNVLQYFMLEPSENAHRLPAYQRLDVSCTYTIKTRWYTLKSALSLINLYSHTNIKSLYSRINSTYDKDGQQNYIIEKISTNSLGFTPNLSLNFLF